MYINLIIQEPLMTNITLNDFRKELGINPTYKAMNDDDKCNHLYEQLSLCGKKSVENILKSCWIYYFVSTNGNFFFEFCDKNGIDPILSKSQIKKYMVIGQNTKKLLKYFDYLPQSWSSIYLIANLPEKNIKDMIAQKLLNRHTTADVIRLFKPKRVTDRIKNPVTYRGRKLKLKINIQPKLSTTDAQEMMALFAYMEHKKLIIIDSKLSFINNPKNSASVDKAIKSGANLIAGNQLVVLKKAA